MFIMQSLIVAVIDAQNTTMPEKPKGCHLTLNNGDDDMEPEGDPLLLEVSIRMYYLRDVPNSGGSFGADIRYNGITFIPFQWCKIIMHLPVFT